MVLGKLDNHIQKKMIRPLPYIIHKTNLKHIKDLNIRTEIVKPLGKKNTRKKFPDNDLGKNFWM